MYLLVVKELGYDPTEVVVGGVRKCCNLWSKKKECLASEIAIYKCIIVRRWRCVWVWNGIAVAGGWWNWELKLKRWVYSGVVDIV